MNFIKNYVKKKYDKLTDHMLVKCISLSFLPNFGKYNIKKMKKSCFKNCLNCLYKNNEEEE